MHLPAFHTDFLRISRIFPARMRRGLLSIFVLIFIQALCEIASILVLSFLAVSISAPDRLLQHHVTGLIFQFVPSLVPLADDVRQFSLCIAGLVAFFIAAKNGLLAMVSWRTRMLGEEISVYAGEAIFRDYMYTPYMRHLAGEAQQMFHALAWRNNLSTVLIQTLNVYCYLCITLVMALMLACFTPGPVLLLLAFISLLGWWVYAFLRNRIQQAGMDSTEWGREQNKVSLNAMNGIREAIIYQQQPTFFAKFDVSNRSAIGPKVFLGLASTIPTWVLETAGFCALALTIWIMLAFANASMARITVVLTMIMLVTWRVLPLLNRMLTALVTVRSNRHAAIQCLERLEGILADPAPMPVPPDPDFTFAREIWLDGVSFTYPGAETESLSQISLAISRGEKIGLIGQSGAGKSSLANILAGLVDPDSGRLLVDGKPLDQARLAAYRQKIGYVPQSPYIMAGSIAENVAFSQWGKPWDEQRVREVCRMAEFEIAEQRGIDSTLGQGGAGLSGGQAQRLSIARALYAGPDLLILDEATSALDSGIEAAIMHTIYNLPDQLTTIIIAHRLSTVERCDRVLWLKNGKMVMLDRPEVVLPAYEKAILPGAEQAMADNDPA